ncbi:MAG: prepilin-type N-terminal cleavage/methylation domain-containing protein [Phycisphaerales bacterium]
MMRAHETARCERGAGVAGFSLFELVVVVVIIALMAGIAIPRFADTNARYRLDAAEHRLQADAKLLEERARATGTKHEIEFDRSSATYTTYVGTGAGRSLLSTVRLGGEPYRASIDAVNVTGGGQTLTFNGYGRAEAGASVIVRVGSGTRTAVLSVDPPADSVSDTPADDEPGSGVLDLLNLPGNLLHGLLGWVTP